MKENIEKGIKAKFGKDKPSAEFALHKEDTYEIGDEKDKESITITIYKHK